MFSFKTLMHGAACRRFLWLAAMALAAPLAAHAQSTTACGASVKADVVNQLAAAAKQSDAEQMKVQAALYDKYKYCGSVDGSRAEPMPALATTQPAENVTSSSNRIETNHRSRFITQSPCLLR